MQAKAVVGPTVPTEGLKGGAGLGAGLADGGVRGIGANRDRVGRGIQGLGAVSDIEARIRPRQEPVRKFIAWSAG